jgi:hypothetical protein
MGLLTWLWQSLTYLFWMMMPVQWRPDTVMMRFRGRAEQAVGQVGEVDELAVRAASRRRWASRLLWALHVVVVLAILVGLWYINYYYDLERVLRSPWPILHKVWLPLLFLLAYLLAWLGWWLWQLLGPDRDTGEFPDIDEAWRAAQRGLARAGIEPSEVPLFLVLGQPGASAENLFAAAHMTLPVRSIPRSPEAPLHVYGSRDGVFVACEGTSLLGRYAALLAKEEEVLGDEPGVSSRAGAQLPAQPAATPEGTSLPVTGEAATATTEAEPQESGGVAVLSGTQPEPLVLTLDDVEPQPRRRQRQSLLKNFDEVERAAARLRYLCRLIARRRHPFCAANGILLVLPMVATDSEADAQEAGAICQHDLSAARDALQVHCPVFALLGDLEKLTGFEELVRYFPEGTQRDRFFGRPFPLVPHLDPTEIPRMLAGGVGWLCLTLFPSVIYRLLRVEESASEERSDVVRDNSRLFQLLSQLREREKQLSRILARGLTTPRGGPVLFGGCYLAATGADAASQQAFVGGVMRHLLDNQNYVSWTAAALAEEADYRRLTWYARAGALILATALGMMVYYFWYR